MRINRTWARRLRANASDAERLLWHCLRKRSLDGARFRRQHPIGPYITDFACISARLVVELDGGQHVDMAESDERRTKYLAARGYHVLRFWNDDVLTRTHDVLSAIDAALRSTPPHPSPAAQGRG